LVVKTLNDLGELGFGCGRRPTGLTRQLAGPYRHERALIRAHLLDHLDQVRARIALDVVFDPVPHWLEGLSDIVHVGAPNVPLVRARMHRDPRSPRLDADPHGFDHARHPSAPGIPERGDFVHVDAEPHHRGES